MSHYHPTPRALLSSKNSPASAVLTAEPPVPVYSDMAIILACLLCGLICVVALMAVARWTSLHHLLLRRRHRPTVAPSAALKREVVELLPRLIFKSRGNGGGGGGDGGKAEVAVAEECVICLGEFVDGEEIRVLPRCSHVFHVACIDRWLVGSRSCSCPSCRQILVVDQCLTSKKGITIISPLPHPPPL